MVLSSSQWWAATGEATYVPKGSIWFDGAADYLTKTFSSSALNTKGTYSFWMKRGMQIPATTETFLSIGSGGGPGANTWLNIRFQSGNDMWCNDYTTLRARTTRVFRDPAAWFHLVFRVDTTLVTPSSRFRIYVNGTEVTSYVTENDWSLNDQINLSGNGHPFLIGQWNSSEYFNGRISEFIFLDGYSAPPSDFATEDSNGVWIPKDPTDTVTDNKGTNGFWLDFASSSDLGNDVSGNNHDFTATSMSADNWSYDRPADDSDTKTGNIGVWSPIDHQGGTGYLINILSNGNRTSEMQGSATANWGGCNLLTIATNSGKWYAEAYIDLRSSGTWGNNYPVFGLGDPSVDNAGSNLRGAIVRAGDGYGSVNGSTAASYLSGGYPNTSVLQIAIDHDNGAVYIGLNDTWGNSATTAEIEGGTTTNALANTGGTGNALAAWSALSDGTYLALGVGSFESKLTIRIPEDEWDYTPPTGFKSIGTQNLPSVTVTKPSNNFLPMIYEGNGASQRVGNFIPFTDSHTVNYSARFDKGDSDHLYWTPSGAGNVQVWTFSTWIKRGDVGSAQIGVIGTSPDGNNFFDIRFSASDTLEIGQFSTAAYDWQYITNQEFDATGNWMNLVVAVDTTAGSGSRVFIYINGTKVTNFSTASEPSASFNTDFLDGNKIIVGGRSDAGSINLPFDGYLSEVIVVDGYQLAASVFGQTDTSTNRWIPKEVTAATLNAAGGGSSGFGTNGFYLNMADGNDLGDDESGNGNDFTESGLDTTNSSNQMYDTPTRNYNVMDGAPVYESWSQALGAYLTEGNLTMTSSGSDNPSGTAFMGVRSGKWYCEIVMNTVLATNSTMAFGIMDKNNLISGQNYVTAENAYGYRNYNGSSSTSNTTGQKFIRGTATTAGTGYGAGDVLGIAVDFDAGKIWMAKNNTWYNDADGTAGNPSAGTYPLMDGIGPSGPQPAGWAIGLYFNNAHAATFNFGQWKYLNNVYGANVCSPGMTVTANSGGTTLSNLVDGDLTTNAYNADGSTGWLQIDLGSGNAKTVTKIWIDFKQDNQYISTFRIQASNSSDMSSAFDFYPTTSVSWSTGEDVTFTKANTTAYRYWRFEKVSGGGSNNLNIFEVEMYESSGSTTLSTDAGGYFKYTPPTDFLAFHQDNLPENTAGITGFSWIKNRDAADNHILEDRVRGIYKYIISNDSNDEATDTQSVQRFLQQGVQVGSMDAVNTSAESYVLWQWVGNGTSNPSVNTDAGFSIATYTGNGTGGRTVTHSLGVAPEFICVKKLGDGDDSTNRHWGVYHVTQGNTKYALLSDTNAFGTSSGYWNNTTPGTSTFAVGTDDSVNGNNAPYVAYCWASVDGYSKFGSYTGNALADGPYIYLGFKPAWILRKKVAAGSWTMTDFRRSPINPADEVLYANNTNTEYDGADTIDICSNGFKIRSADTGANPTSEVIYAAFAENPFGGSGIAQAKAR